MVNGRRTIGPLKTKASHRTIPMPLELLDLLQAHQEQQNARRLAAGPVWEGNDLVFCTKDGRPINARLLLRDFDHWCVAAGVPRIRIHDLRHLFISTAIRLGADVKSVVEIVGHSKTAITMEVYTHTMQAQHESVVDKVSASYRVTPSTLEETP